jgi:hypothetical protein
MTDESIPKKILSKPLPQVLNEIMETTERNDKRIDQVEQIARSAVKLAELLKLALTEGVSSIDKRLLDDTLAKDKADSGG